MRSVVVILSDPKHDTANKDILCCGIGIFVINDHREIIMCCYISYNNIYSNLCIVAFIYHAKSVFEI